MEIKQEQWQRWQREWQPPASQPSAAVPWSPALPPLLWLHCTLHSCDLHQLWGFNLQLPQLGLQHQQPPQSLASVSCPNSPVPFFLPSFYWAYAVRSRIFWQNELSLVWNIDNHLSLLFSIHHYHDLDYLSVLTFLWVIAVRAKQHWVWLIDPWLWCWKYFGYWCEGSSLKLLNSSSLVPLVRLCLVLFLYNISSALEMPPHAPSPTPQLSHHSMHASGFITHATDS